MERFAVTPCNNHLLWVGVVLNRWFSARHLSFSIHHYCFDGITNCLCYTPSFQLLLPLNFKVTITLSLQALESKLASCRNFVRDPPRKANSPVDSPRYFKNLLSAFWIVFVMSSRFNYIQFVSFINHDKETYIL